MRTAEKTRRLLEWMHPVFLYTLICPFFYVFFKERTDAFMPGLYFSGFSLLLCAIASRAAAGRVISFGKYLAVLLPAAACSVTIGWLAAGWLVSPGLRQALLVEQLTGCVLMSLDSVRIRMREKRRKKAERENDISWNETPILLEKPGISGLACSCVVYVAALLNHCPVLCDLALLNCMLYALLLLLHRHLETTAGYLADTSRLSNVPAGKIHVLRKGLFLLLFSIVVLVCLTAWLTGKKRVYRDLRFYEYTTVFGQPEPAPDFSGGMTPEMLRLWFPELLQVKETPAWMKQVSEILGWAVLTLALGLLLTGIYRYFLAFRGTAEENGDIAVQLDQKEQGARIHARRRSRFPWLSEKDRIRRRYKKVIRRYHPGRPLPSDTPAQIEAGTAFPSSFPVRELHESYEQARYGKEPGILPES